MERYNRRMATPAYRAEAEIGRMKTHLIFGFFTGVLMGVVITLAFIDLTGGI